MSGLLINPGQYPSAPLQRMRMEVVCRGELVDLVVGNTTLTMPYDAALQLSQWLRVRGKEAKRNAGDLSRHWSVIGLLEGVE